MYMPTQCTRYVRGMSRTSCSTHGRLQYFIEALEVLRNCQWNTTAYCITVVEQRKL